MKAECLTVEKIYFSKKIFGGIKKKSKFRIPKIFSRKFFLTLIVLSEDGKYLIPIYNNNCFLPSTLHNEEKFWNAFTVNTALQPKSILFCLNEMDMPIPSEVRKHLLSIDFDLLLTTWMTELVKIEEKCNNLIDQDQRTRFLEHDTVIRIPFYIQFIKNLHWKVHKIQTMLNISSALTPFDLLKAIEPFAAKCYQKSFKQMNTIQNRFKAVTNQLYTKTFLDENRASILNSRTMMEIINVSEKDLQKDVAFQKIEPVNVLKLLSKLIQKRHQRNETEQELLFELDEGTQENKWRNLFGNRQGEAALRAFFSNPKVAFTLKGSKLIPSHLLSKLFLQSRDSGMKIRFLSLLNSPSLGSQEIRIFAEECPNLEFLDVSGSPKLKEIVSQKEEWPLLARLEAKECFALKKFVSYSPIRILRIGTATSIEIFVEKHSLDIFTILPKANKLELIFKRGKQLKIKILGKSFSNDDFFLGAIPEKEEIAEYFKDWKITIGRKEFIFTTPWSTVFQLIFQLNSHLNDIYPTGERTPSSDIFWVNPSLLNASESEISCALNSSWVSILQLDVSHSNIGDEVAKTLTESLSLPNIIELNVNENNIGVESANTSSILKNHQQYLNSRLDQISNLVIEENPQYITASEPDFNKNDNRNTRKTESSKNTPQINNSHVVQCGNKITAEELIQRDKPQFNSLEHVGLSQEASDESVKKTGSMAQEGSLSESKILFNFLKTQERFMHEEK